MLQEKTKKDIFLYLNSQMENFMKKFNENLRNKIWIWQLQLTRCKSAMLWKCRYSMFNQNRNYFIKVWAFTEKIYKIYKYYKNIKMYKKNYLKNVGIEKGRKWKKLKDHSDFRFTNNKNYLEIK